MVCECDGKGCEGNGMKYDADWMVCTVNVIGWLKVMG